MGSKKLSIEILKEFSKSGINFCILRNYEDFSSENDIDILISKEDVSKVHPIAQKFKLRKGIDLGNYLSYKNEEVWLDLKVGGVPYNGFVFGSSEELLSKKRKFEDFYVLEPEIEFIHLILHSIIDKGSYKEKYMKRLENLRGVVDHKRILNILQRKFGDIGERLFFLVISENYEKSLLLKKKIFRKLLNLKNLPNYIAIKAIKILR